MKIIRVVAILSSLVLFILVMPMTLLAANAGPVNPSAVPVNIELCNVTVKEAIDSLFKISGIKYYIEPGVKTSGKIAELSLKGITFDQALAALTDAAGITYSIKDGAYLISKTGSKALITQRTAPNAGMQYQGAIGSGPAGNYAQQALAQPGPAQPQTSPQVVINQPGPTYNGSTGPTTYGGGNDNAGGYGGYGYGYGGVYRSGNASIIGGGYGSSVVVGGNPFITGFGTLPPPPPGWVSPDQLRFLRGTWTFMNRPFISYGY